MKLLQILLIMLIFSIGFITSQLFEGALATSGLEVASPSDRISEDQIRVYEDKIIIDVQGAEWATFKDTNSMDPFLDKGANALQMIPQTIDDISVGDIVSYKRGNERIIHRVVYIGEDSEGTYFIVKGDNNPTSDPGRVRFSQIDRVLFAIIY